MVKWLEVLCYYIKGNRFRSLSTTEKLYHPFTAVNVTCFCFVSETVKGGDRSRMGSVLPMLYQKYSGTFHAHCLCGDKVMEIFTFYQYDSISGALSIVYPAELHREVCSASDSRAEVPGSIPGPATYFRFSFC